jgi:hypothetical protein
MNMKNIMSKGWQTALILIATATVAAGVTTNGSVPEPGALNYVEGQVSLDGQSLSPKSVHGESLEPNQVLETGSGNAEVLLTPGVFLRVGNNTEVRMISPDLADTRVQLVNGKAMLEVAELFKQNNLGVVVNGATTQIEKQGLYAFNASQPSAAVLDGEARVFVQDQSIKLKKGHEINLSGTQSLKAYKVDKAALNNDSLYRWSELRSEYEAAANVDAARTVIVNGGWYGAGWYWDPFWSMYSFLPGNGILYSPFGWGFYSPGWVAYAPYYFGRYPVIAGRTGYARAGGTVASRGMVGQLPAGSRPAYLSRGASTGVPRLMVSPRPTATPGMTAPRALAAPSMSMGGFRGGFSGVRGGRR